MIKKIKSKLQKLHSRFSDYRDKRKRRGEITMEEVERLNQMLEDYKRENGL